ncbi:MAG TPA: hypothetical protein VFQ53_42350 [Kofleriaceae bacterium]|nr:hypothetical protein [Kofleriaceae bacterium]
MSCAGAFALAATSCGETTANAPSQLNLDRPTDITFACWGGLRVTDGRTEGQVTDPVTVTAQPTTACEIRSGDHATGTPTPVPPGQEDLTSQGGTPVGNAFWFGFILQSGPGTVALAQFQTKPSTAFNGADVAVLDADPLTPGKNSISVGEDPIAIGTDTTGCKVVTANAGSCDLSVLDVTTAVDNIPETPIDVRRLEVTNATGVPIHAKPAAMVMEPATDVIGKTCSETASGLAYIAYPSCHLVAAVDLSTGKITSGISFAGGTPAIVDGNVTCPDECAGEPSTAGIRPVALDLEKDPRTAERRMVIGADNSPSLTIVELSETTTLPESVAGIALANTTGDLGVTKLAMSPQIGMGGAVHVVNDDTAAGGQFQFVYAIATDDSVRVADILNVRRECDTQIDPRYLRDIRSISQLSCLPVGDPTLPERPGAGGPGIRIGVPPLSVDIIKSEQVEGDLRPDESVTKLIGYFALITSTAGDTFVANVDDDDFRDLYQPDRPLLAPLNKAIAHQLRDAVPAREVLATEEINDEQVPTCDINGPPDLGGGVYGGPRSTQPPARQNTTGIVAPEKVTELPGLRQITCTDTSGPRAITEVAFTAPEAVRDFVFPDFEALAPEETWTMTWEGPFSISLGDSDIGGPRIREGEIFVDGAGMHLRDQTRPFCQVGVQRNDIVQLRGCDPSIGDADCPIGYTCFVHPDSKVPGLGACMLEDEADRLAVACKDFLTSLRRYTIGTTASGEVQLMPRKHVLRTTPVEGCTSNEQCDALADFAATNASSAHPVDETATDDKTWSCEADPTRAPVTTGKRCLLKCDTTDDCFTGTICQGAVAGAPKSGYCMEGVIPPQSCVNAPQRYEPRVGEAFAVVGSLSGFVDATIEDAGGQCVRAPGVSPLLTSRIPLTPPACDPTADPLTGRRTDGTFEPNPCSFTVDNTDIVPLYLPGTCTLADPPSELRVRQAPAIRYRNRGMNLTIVDPTYPGDAMCIADRGGTLGNIPLVFTNYQIAFRQTAGFVPLRAPINPSLPVKVVRGPTNSVWVIDEGDTLSTSIGQASTRGKVFRMEHQALNLVNVLE